MANKTSAARYAQAVFELALEKKELERWQIDLREIAGTLEDTSFLAALEHPKIKIEDKTQFLKKRLGKISPLALNLALLLINRTSISLISQIADEYERLVNEYKGIETAQVVTAVPLDAAEKKELAVKLGEVTGAKVELKTEVDPSILGGVVARMGGKLLDGSTRTKLAALKRELAGEGKR